MENKTNTMEYGIGEALVMCRENVSPSKDMLVNILSQIPEKENLNNNGRRAIRSPYIWLAITQVVALCSIVLAVYPTFTKVTNDPFYLTDKKVETFEQVMQQLDYQDNVMDSTL